MTNKETPAYGECTVCQKHFGEGENIFKVQKLQRSKSHGANPVISVEFTLEYCFKCFCLYWK